MLGRAENDASDSREDAGTGRAHLRGEHTQCELCLEIERLALLNFAYFFDTGAMPYSDVTGQKWRALGPVLAEAQIELLSRPFVSSRPVPPLYHRKRNPILAAHDDKGVSIPSIRASQ